MTRYSPGSPPLLIFGVLSQSMVAFAARVGQSRVSDRRDPLRSVATCFDIPQVTSYGWLVALILTVQWEMGKIARVIAKFALKTIVEIKFEYQGKYP